MKVGNSGLKSAVKDPVFLFLGLSGCIFMTAAMASGLAVFQLLFGAIVMVLTGFLFGWCARGVG